MSVTGNIAAKKILRGKMSSCEMIYMDAYELAVLHGFEGTIEEWLESIKGEKGDAPDAVLHTTQVLTEEQKAQARLNIDAAPDGFGLGMVIANYPKSEDGTINGDPNDAWATGVYKLRSLSANTPDDSKTWRGLLTLSFTNALAYQYIYNSNGDVAMRFGNKNTKTWGNWKMLNYPKTEEIVADVIAALPIYSGEVEEV